MNSDRMYEIALTLVPQIGRVHARILVERLGDAKSVFHTNEQLLRKIEGLGDYRARSIARFKDFQVAEDELKYIDAAGIHCRFLTDKDYPRRLLHCYDAPVMLYQKGLVDLNGSRIIAVVGTRNNSEYGRGLTDKLISELREMNIVVVSGLAFGIDAIAHRAALKNELPTIGVLAHGMDSVYPSQHSSLALEMIESGGGLLTEFRRGTIPDRHNFPSRNRIVAGMSDAVIVVETGVKGGSMITAELANGYNKDVFSFPGRVSDTRSAGCHHLVRQNKAILITCAADLISSMNWDQQANQAVPVRQSVQKALFPNLSENERLVLGLLKENESVAVDEVNLRSGLSSSATASALLSLELQQVIVSLPGKLYRLT